MEATALQGDFQCVFVVFFSLHGTNYSSFIYPWNNLLFQVLIRQIIHIACPSQLVSIEHGKYAHHVYPPEIFCILNPPLPFNVKKLPEVPSVE